MGLEVLVAGIAAGGTFGATVTAVYGVVGAAALRLAGGLLLSAASAALAKKPQQQELKRDLQFPTSRPAYRFPYGQDRIPGTALPSPVVGGYFYACYLVSSRPSDGGFAVFIDDREVLLTGDPHDFTQGGGATATEFPFQDHCTVWIGLGDQTSPPFEFTDEAGYVDGGDELLWKASDAGEGCTVVFVKYKAGDNGQRAERWPSQVPMLELEGRFAKVWSPGDVTQSFDDPTTWKWSENASDCALDLLTQNPFRPYELRNLELEMWKAYATEADILFALKSGGTEKQFVTAGVVVFDGSELDQLMQPLLACGGARLTRAGGQLGVVPAVPRTSAVTITDSLEGLSFSSLIDDASLITELRVNYSPAERGGEPGELAPWEIPGALAADGGQPSVKTLDLSMVPSATQAQRLRNIVGRTARLQRSVRIVAPPSALKAVAGSVITLDQPAPYGAHVNGTFEVKSIGAAVHVKSEDGLEMRVPMVLTQYSNAVYVWDEDTDEEEVIHAAYNSQREGVDEPGVLSVSSGYESTLDTGGSISPRFLFEFDPSASASADHYEWEWRLSGEEYQSGGTIPGGILNGSGKVFFYLPVASITQGHDVRVRTVSPKGRSGWRVLSGAIYSFGLAGVSGTAGMGFATFTGTSPDSAVFRGVRVYRGAVGSSFDDATLVMGVEELERGEAFTVYAGDSGATDLISNGALDDATGWTLGPGWSIAGGKATSVPGIGANLSSAAALVSGTDYRWSLDVTDYNGGTGRFRLFGTVNAQSTTFVSAGFQSGILTAPASPTDAGVVAFSNADYSVDNIAVYADGPQYLAQGEADYWLVPVTLTGGNGQPSAPITLTIL